MIFAEKSEPNEKVFLELLEETKSSLISILSAKTTKPNSLEFESLVCDVMSERAVGTEYEDTIRQTGVSAFPDIIAKGYFGVEVKMTIKDHWKSVGNSVLESLRIEGVERIFIMFGKFGGALDIKYRLYQECLPTISVTHSPRYQIDMNLPDGHTIFDKMGVSYDNLRKSGNTIQKVKNYFRTILQEGEGLWWIDDESEAPSPIIKQLRTLDANSKLKFKVQSLIYFPELYRNRANYDRAAAFLITEFGAVSASLRDEFSAGGRQDLLVADEIHSVPQIISQLYEYASEISKEIYNLDESLLKYYWKTDFLESDRLQQWKNLIDEAAQSSLSSQTPSVVFNAGCNQKTDV
jgi:hypothetical protein